MAFIIVGVLLLVLKWAGIGPFAQLSWWWVLLPFGLAAVWWQISDSLGLTQKRAIQRMEDRKAERRERDMVALGLNTRREKRLEAIRSARQRTVTDGGGGAADPKDAGRRS